MADHRQDGSIMIRRLILTNGIAVVGVAVHHASAFGFQSLFNWTDRYLAVTVPNFDQLGSMQYYGLLIVRQLDAFTIPVFLFVSGYFITAFAARGGESELKYKDVVPRIKVLIPPFILWTLARYLLLRQPPSNLHDILLPYYYIPLLIQCYLLSPILIPVTKRWPRTVLIVAALIQVIPETLFWYLDSLGYYVPNQLPLYLFPRRIFWFIFGVVLSCYLEPIRHWMERAKWYLLVATIGLAMLTLAEYQAVQINSDLEWIGPNFWGLSRQLYAFAFILTLLAFKDVTLPFARQFSELGGRSLGVYLANIPVIYVAAVFMYHFAPWMLGNQLLYQLVLLIVGLTVPLLLMEFTRKSPARRAYRLVFG